MPLLGKIERETYLKPSRRRNQSYQRPERQRITTVEQWVDTNKYKQILTVEYVEGTRKPTLLKLYKNKGKECAVIMLMGKGTYQYLQFGQPPIEVVNVRLNQRTGKLTFNELELDGTIGPEQEHGIQDDIPTGLLLLAFPIGWFILCNRAQIRSIRKSWESILDAASDAYSVR